MFGGDHSCYRPYRKKTGRAIRETGTFPSVPIVTAMSIIPDILVNVPQRYGNSRHLGFQMPHVLHPSYHR